MATTSKAAARRGKPSYIMSIIGVTLVLFLLGIVGWLAISAPKIGDALRENVEVRVYLSADPVQKDSAAIMQYFAGQTWVKNHEFVNKEMARQKFMEENSTEDPLHILDANPLPHAVYFVPKKEYVELDSLDRIASTIRTALPSVTEIQYPKQVVSELSKWIRNTMLMILGLSVVLAVVVIILIDNTIRLAMFSNRFLIKTMQMVGATRNFIARPLNIRAVINGSISAAIAIVLIYGLIRVAENFIPWLHVVNTSGSLLMLFLALLVIGISITLFSTYRSVLKYLRMKLDELY